MNAPSLSAALEKLGIRCEVEEQGRLAVIIPISDIRLDARDRRTIVALGRARGFTNVCVELRPLDATISGD